MSSDGLETGSKRSEALFESLLRAAAAVPRQKIPPRKDHNPAPLSSVQQGFWLTHQLNPADTAYNVTKAFLLRGPLDRAPLEKSVNEIISRHEILRTTIAARQGYPVQSIQPASYVPLPLVDLRSDPDDDLALKDTPVRDFVLQESQIPFDLSTGPLLRLSLLGLGTEKHLLLLLIHHVIVDGWSVQLFKQELASLYESFSSGIPSTLADLPIQYADFAFWERERLHDGALAGERAYWKEKLADSPATSTLPSDRPRPALQVSRGGHELLLIPDELAGALKKLSRQEGATLFMTLLAAFYALLYRYAGQTDLIVGSPITSRHHRETRDLIGCFLNTLVLRCDLGGNPTFRDLLGRVRQMALEAYENQALPFESVLETVRPVRNLSHSPLFQVMFNHLDFVRPVPAAAGLEILEVTVERGGNLFDLFVETVEDGRTLSFAVSYNRDLFDAETIQRFARHYVALLQEIVANPDCALDNISILTPEENALLASWNRTDADYSRLPDLLTQFYQQVDRHPRDTAYIFEGWRMSYAELNARSNQLAHYLVESGARPGTRIGVALERSLDVPAAVLAILKTRAVYVPLDPTYPRERLRFISADSDLHIVITSSQWQKLFARDEGEQEKRQILCLDNKQEQLSRQPAGNLPAARGLDDGFFIVYTSGSGGRPKGVEYRQRAILNRLAWMWETYPVQPQEIGCQKTALSFVDSLWEMFGYLLQGAPTVIVPDEAVRDTNLLVDTLAREKVTRLWLVPSLLRTILQTQPDLQKRLPLLTFWVCSGEALPSDLAQQFRQTMPAAQLHNPYGTSELWCVSWYDPDKNSRQISGPTVPIGRPIGNTRIYVVDGAQKLAPLGAAGELWVSGAGLAQGYVGRPQLTAERFMPNPFATREDESPANENPYARVYRTGDLVRLLANGDLEFLGRADRQINIRGMRIEPGEIEALLRRHPAVTDAAVITYGEDQRKRLVAYVAAAGESEKLPAELRGYVAEWLPNYMVPWRIVPLRKLPLTPSGKVDRRALSTIALAPVRSGTAAAMPRTVNEQALAEIWQEVLGLDSVDIHTNFFDAGGHSLLGVQLFALVEERLGKRLPLNLLFLTPTVAQLAQELQKSADEDRVLVPIQPSGQRPPFFAAHGVFGDMLAFSNVLQHLPADQPFYGFQAVGLHPNRPPDQTIEGMAARYIMEMRRIQPRGPYYLGGYCFGGVLAYEMACQLLAEGEQTALLAIIEGSAPRHLHERAPFYSPLRLQTARQAFPTWARGNKEFGGWRVGMKIRSRFGRPDRRSHAPLPDEAADEEAHNLADYKAWRPAIQQQLREYHRDMLHNYSPQPYGGRVTLIRARSLRVSRALLVPFDPQRGWGSLATGGVDVRFVNGTHSTILKEPNASELAHELTNVLHQSTVGLD